MDKFLNEFAEILDVDVSVLTPDLVLSKYLWDSLAIISTIVLVNDLYGKILEPEILFKCEKLSDIIELIQGLKTK